MTSKPLTITPDTASSQLEVFAPQPPAPSAALVGKALAPKIIVKSVDRFGNLVTTDHSKILLATNTGSFTGSECRHPHQRRRHILQHRFQNRRYLHPHRHSRDQFHPRDHHPPFPSPQTLPRPPRTPFTRPSSRPAATPLAIPPSPFLRLSPPMLHRRRFLSPRVPL